MLINSSLEFGFLSVGQGHNQNQVLLLLTTCIVHPLRNSR